MENSYYVILSSYDKDEINYEEFLNQCYNITRKNMDESLFILQYEGEIPSSLENKIFAGPYLNEEIVELLANDDQWNFNIDDSDYYSVPSC